jgi:type IV pilus assembly protein PilB
MDNGMKQMMDDLLQLCVDEGASDLHIRAFLPPMVRIHGSLTPCSEEPFTPEDTIALMKVITSEEKQHEVETNGGADFAHPYLDLARFRVSVFKERGNIGLVLRQIPSKLLTLEQIGLPEQVKELLFKPRGLVLVTGPTGSGKTTTLYSILRRINQIDTKLLTAEEPVEYDMEGIIQVPITYETGNTFPKVLRAFLRQDPDIMMIGEIRDLETAEIAIQAALTGHLVFSTLHTNDAAGAVMRFVDMNVAPYMVASTLEAVLGQRLLRTCCKECKVSYEPDDEQLDRINLKRDEIGGRPFWFGKGCKTCNGTGYKGRKGIFEYLRVSNPIRELINSKAPTLVIREKARELGMRTMREDGVRAILDGYTTVDEVLRYT